MGLHFAAEEVSPDISISKAPASDLAKCQITSLLQLAQEPIMKSVGIPGVKFHYSIVDQILDPLDQGNTLLAVGSPDQGIGGVLGVAVNKMITPETLKHQKDVLIEKRCERLRRYCQLLVAVHDHSKLFERFCLSRLMEVQVLAVHPTARNMGVAFALVRASRDVAVERGAPLIALQSACDVVDHICYSQGWEQATRQSISAYRNVQGQPIAPGADQTLTVWFYRLSAMLHNPPDAGVAKPCMCPTQNKG